VTKTKKIRILENRLHESSHNAIILFRSWHNYTVQPVSTIQSTVNCRAVSNGLNDSAITQSKKDIGQRLSQ